VILKLKEHVGLQKILGIEDEIEKFQWENNDEDKKSPKTKSKKQQAYQEDESSSHWYDDDDFDYDFEPAFVSDDT
jgi:hypothetical protein